MMFKKFQSIPANTTSSNPNWQKLQVVKGTIVQWVIFSDPEAANLLHMRVFYHGVQLIPFSKDEWLEAFFDNTPITESIKLDAPPYVLDIYAYNEDDSYAHEYYIQPVIIPDKPITVTEGIEGVWERLRDFFGGT